MKYKKKIVQYVSIVIFLFFHSLWKQILFYNILKLIYFFYHKMLIISNIFNMFMLDLKVLQKSNSYFLISLSYAI